MKNRLLIFVSVLFVSAAFVQCKGDCANEECDNAPPPTFSFRLLNSANKDLLVGPAKQYDSANLKITAKAVSNGNISNITRLFYYIGDSIATTGFVVNKSYSVYYLSLNNAVTDSMLFCKLPFFPVHSKLEFFCFLVILGKRINKKLVEHFPTNHAVFHSYNLAAIPAPFV